jgi:hypothetical protein
VIRDVVMSSTLMKALASGITLLSRLLSSISHIAL